MLGGLYLRLVRRTRKCRHGNYGEQSFVARFARDGQAWGTDRRAADGSRDETLRSIGGGGGGGGGSTTSSRFRGVASETCNYHTCNFKLFGYRVLEMLEAELAGPLNFVVATR